MNNNYYNFNPNSFYPNPALMRSVGTPFRAPVSTLPRLSSLFGRSAAGVSAGAAGASKVTFSSLLNGASKTLGVINQAIPVFYQVKPIWRNAKTMFKVVKEINNKDDTNSINNVNTNTNSNSNTNNTSNENINTLNKDTNNSPTFFI
ncbi:MAG: VrrA/YqfQ family protein [bacterium]|nr:VrrA/YqfQ family protein [bacterium]